MLFFFCFLPWCLCINLNEQKNKSSSIQRIHKGLIDMDKPLQLVITLGKSKINMFVFVLVYLQKNIYADMVMD